MNGGGPVSPTPNPQAAFLSEAGGGGIKWGAQTFDSAAGRVEKLEKDCFDMLEGGHM